MKGARLSEGRQGWGSSGETDACGWRGDKAADGVVRGGLTSPSLAPFLGSWPVLRTLLPTSSPVLASS